MQVEIINTGSELLLGRILNTHQQWLCRRLTDLGLLVTRQVAVADAAAEIQAAVREALDRADLVITTGGLGPTSDDITREHIAGLLGRKLMESPAVREHIDTFFAKRGRPRPARTHVENFVPEGATVFLNAFGTAPGLAIQVGKNIPGSPAHFDTAGTATEKWLIMLPGPPRELRPMFDEQVVPLLKRTFTPTTFVGRTLRTTGLGESLVQEKLEADLQPLVKRGLDVGYSARPGAVEVRLVATGTTALEVVKAAEAIVQANLRQNIYGFDDEEIEQSVVHQLQSKRLTLALAESCTGGAIASRVTDVPGASEVFLGGVVSYSNAAKMHLLGVRPETLAVHGAVSDAVACEMAAGAREKFGADFALAVTGIAGPDGGSPEKPVGTVFIALASAEGVAAQKFLNHWDRATFKNVTSTQALDWMRREISA